MYIINYGLQYCTISLGMGGTYQSDGGSVQTVYRYTLVYYVSVHIIPTVDWYTGTVRYSESYNKLI